MFFSEFQNFENFMFFSDLQNFENFLKSASEASEAAGINSEAEISIFFSFFRFFLFSGKF